MSTEETRAVIRKWFALLEKGNEAGLIEMIADDVRYHLIGSTPLSGEVNGLQVFLNDFLPKMGPLTKGPIKLTVDQLIVDGDRAVALVRGEAEGHHGEYNNSYAMFFELRDGKVVTFEEYCDTCLIERALFGRQFAET